MSKGEKLGFLSFQLLQQESITYAPKEPYSDGLSSSCILRSASHICQVSESLRAANREKQT